MASHENMDEKIYQTLFVPEILFVSADCPAFFTYLYSYAVHQKSTKVKVGIVADKDNVFVREIQEELLSKTGMITFCEISSEKDMIQKIRKGDLTCGYVFPDTLKSNMKMGSMKNALSNTTVREMPFF